MENDKHAAIEMENVAIDEKVAVAAAGEHLPIDVLAEERLLRKVDLHVIPMLTILFLMAFLDRTNIGRFPFSNPSTLTNMAIVRKCQNPRLGERSENEGQ